MRIGLRTRRLDILVRIEGSAFDPALATTYSEFTVITRWVSSS